MIGRPKQKTRIHFPFLLKCTKSYRADSVVKIKKTLLKAHSWSNYFCGKSIDFKVGKHAVSETKQYVHPPPRNCEDVCIT